MITRSFGSILVTGRLFQQCVVPQRSFKVLVTGGSSAIGQTITLLLKHNPLVSDLNIYDESCDTPGVAMDLNHINRCPKVWGFRDPKTLAEAVKGSNVVIIAGGIKSSSNVGSETLFCTNAGVVYRTAQKVAEYAPDAITLIATNPVNSLVPTAAEVMKKVGNHSPNKLFGVTTLDVMRASTFVADIYWMDPSQVTVPVIGGHAGCTIIPVLSQCNVEIKLPASRIRELTKLIQEAETEVVKAKKCKGAAILSPAYAVARFTDAVLKGLSGKENIVECAYVESCVSDAKFFANPLKLGKCGLERNLGCGKLNDYECEQLRDAQPILKQQIETGIKFANNFQDTYQPK